MGTAVMIIGIVAMVVIHELGHFVAAKAFGMKATQAFFGFGPRIWSTTRGETEYGIKALPLGGYVRIIGMNPLEEIPPEDEARTYRTAVFWKKSVVVLAGVFSHVVMAALLLLIVLSVWGVVATDDDGNVIPTLELSVVAAVTPEGDPSPAHLAGFAEGDALLTYDGAPMTSWEQFVDLLRADGGEAVTIGYERDGIESEETLTLALVDRPVLDDEGRAVTDDDGNVVYEEVGYFGAAPSIEREQPGVIGTITAVGRGLGEAIGQSFYGLWRMIVGLPDLVMSVFGGSDEVLDEVRPISPIGLVRLAGPLESTLMMLALVNVFVGVLNFIPLYPFDGGHFAVAIYEKVTGRAPDVTKLLPVAAVVIVFLITVGFLGVFLDIFRPIQL